MENCQEYQQQFPSLFFVLGEKEGRKKMKEIDAQLLLLWGTEEVLLPPSSSLLLLLFFFSLIDWI
jgi:hypothetical protein